MNPTSDASSLARAVELIRQADALIVAAREGLGGLMAGLGVFTATGCSSTAPPGRMPVLSA